MISIEDMEIVFKTVTEETDVILTTDTELKMLKKQCGGSGINPYYGKVYRLLSRPVILGGDYQRLITDIWHNSDSDLAKYDFKVSSLWRGMGEHIDDSKYFVRHKGTGRRYLLYLIKPGAKAFIDRYYLKATGMKLDFEELERYMSEPPETIGVQMTAQTGAMTVYPRTTALENIKSIIINNEVYQ